MILQNKFQPPVSLVLTHKNKNLARRDMGFTDKKKIKSSPMVDNPYSLVLFLDIDYLDINTKVRVDFQNVQTFIGLFFFINALLLSL